MTTNSCRLLTFFSLREVTKCMYVMPLIVKDTSVTLRSGKCILNKAAAAAAATACDHQG